MSIGTLGVGIAGAGALASNVILVRVVADVATSTVRSPSTSPVSISATMSGSITAKVIGVAVSVAIGVGGIGAAIGVSIARNLIGWRPDADPSTSADTRESTLGLVKASVTDASIDAGGALQVWATGSSTITAEVEASAVAASGGLLAFGASGAGASTRNRIATAVIASIDGDGATGIGAASVSVRASNTSSIYATTGAAGVAVAIGLVGVAVSVTRSETTNEITTSVLAQIRNADGDGNPATTTDLGGVVARTGGVSVEATDTSTIHATGTASAVAASGGIVGVSYSDAGADVLNVILGSVVAQVVDSRVDSEGSALVAAKQLIEIRATVAALATSVAIGLGAGGVATGSSWARNFVGYSPAFVLGTATGSPVVALVSGSVVTGRGGLSVTAEVGPRTPGTRMVESQVNTSSFALAVGISFAVGSSASVSFNAVAFAVKAGIVATEVPPAVPGGAVTYRRSTVDVDGTVTIAATDTTALKTDAQATSLAIAIGISGSVAVGRVVNTNTVASTVDSVISRSDVTAGALDMDATQTIDSLATGRTATESVGVLFSVSSAGALVASTVTSAVRSTVGDGSVLVIDGLLGVTATGDVDGSATAIATSTSGSLLADRDVRTDRPRDPDPHRPRHPRRHGDLRRVDDRRGDPHLLGNLGSGSPARTEPSRWERSEATTTLRPVVTASLSGRTLRSTGGGISVVARYNRTGAGLNTGDDAEADAQTSSGGLVAVSGGSSTATNSPDVSASGVGTVAASSGVTIRTYSAAIARSSTDGSAGGLVGVGSTATTARADGEIDAAFTGSIAPLLGTTTSSLTVEVFATHSARARSDSSAGGLFGGTNDNSYRVRLP